jgi:3-deoxy-D-manno-octulosonate 8-phosphate phosphatase (KDO 8-P phosphatase)
MDTTMSHAISIRLLALDLDGIFTNGCIHYSTSGDEIRTFHVHDGLGIKLIQQAGIQVAIISAKNSTAVSKRIRELNISHVYLGQEDKLPAYEDLKQTCQLTDQEIAYMGDDLPDLPLLNRAGFSITVPQAPAIIQQQVDYITKNHAGKGAVREVCELILNKKGLYQSVLQSYLK